MIFTRGRSTGGVEHASLAHFSPGADALTDTNLSSFIWSVEDLLRGAVPPAVTGQVDVRPESMRTAA